MRLLTRRIAVAAALSLTVGGCSSSSGSDHASSAKKSHYEIPSPFYATTSSVPKMVRAAVDGADAAANTKSADATCVAGKSCAIRYEIEEPTGISFDIEILLPVREVFKHLFDNRKFESASVSVQGPVTTVGGKSDVGEYFRIACNRTAAAQIDWDNVNADGLRTLCAYHKIVK